MYAILKKPLNLANEINVEQKQCFSWSWILDKTKINVGKSVHFVAVLQCLNCFSLVISHFCCDSGLSTQL